MSPPSVPLFPADYFGDTKHLTCEQHGAYLQLLLLAWEMPDCAIPDDDWMIARMVNISLRRWRVIKPVVMAFWKLENNRWTQRRLTRERTYIENQIQLRRAAGSLGGIANALKNKDRGLADALAKGVAKPYPPTPTPLKKEKKEKEMDRVWVARDTPEWTAWQRVRRQESVFSADHQQNGWWFKTQWPPDPLPSPATKEAAE